MSLRTAVAIYARISQDREGTALGVTRQLEDCRAEAGRRGWEVAEEYVDDDLSASSYTSRPRPRYAQMLADIDAGLRDAVVVWHMDRLHRRPIELEEFAGTCTRGGLSEVVTLHGDLNIGNGDGLLVARLLAAVAANESDAKSRRSRRKMQELAEAGRPHGGGTRPFGFEDDRITHNPAEAQAVRDMAARALAGESLTSLCRWLADNEVRTVMGGEWRTPTLRSLLTNPRIYGMRTHSGAAVTKAVWEPIISVQDGERLRALLLDPARRTNRSARSYLLSGMCRCALCGTMMVSAPREQSRRYLCRSGHDFGGCGKMSIAAPTLEVFVSRAVLVRLDSPALADALTDTRADDARQAELAAQVRADAAKLDELSVLWADGAINATEWRTARDRIDARLKTNRRTLVQARGHQQLDSLIGTGEALAAKWDGLNLNRQASIVKALVDHVAISSAAVPGRHGLDVGRIAIQWRL